MRISQLEGKRVALWGWGREGRAAYAALRARLPQQPLTLFCSEAEAADASACADPLLAIEHAATGDRLAAFDEKSATQRKRLLDVLDPKQHGQGSSFVGGG